jgi:asparagine synthetase B (glutamine-hydrolysing)
VQPYPEWIAPALERRLDLRNRWQSENAAQDLRPGFELAHAYWPFCIESLDPGSMQLAAEIRYPFLDVRLARYLLRLPPIPWGPEKSLLRVAMKGVLPEKILRRRKAPLAGNPWAALLPSAQQAWWKPYMSPAPPLEDFVDVDVATATLAGVTRAAQATNRHSDVDRLRSSLRPMSLNLWLRQPAYTRVHSPQLATSRE